MPALEGGARPRPQRPDDLDALLEPVGAVVLRAELQPQHAVLVLRPAGADAELQASAGQVVDRGSHLRQHGWMAIGVADHRAPDPRARRQLRHRRQHRPGLEDRAVVPWAQRGEVVHHPAAVEARFVGETPEAAHLLDGRVLTELEPEPQSGHPAVISHADSSSTAQQDDVHDQVWSRPSPRDWSRFTSPRPRLHIPGTQLAFSVLPSPCRQMVVSPRNRQEVSSAMDSRAPDSWTAHDDRNADGPGSSPWPPSATGPTDGLPRRHGEPEVPAPSSRMRRRGGGPRVAVAATLAAGLAVGAGIAAHASTTTPPTAAAPAASSAAAGSQGAGWNGPYGRGRLIPGGGPVGSGTTSQALAAATSAQETGVVDINVTLRGTEQAAGTGMILTSDGEVLTNRHVVEGETSISVTVTATGRTYSARVVGISTTTDVAVVHLTGASGLATVKTSSAAVAVGTSVVGVGNAGGTGGTPSAAAGTVTGVNQSITASDTDGSNPEQLSGLIETDAGIQPGDSGGPLLNASDTVVGMDTAASSQGDDAYAIPIATALAVAHQIETGGGGAQGGGGGPAPPPPP